MNPFTSQITFLNFQDFAAGQAFVTDILGLQKVYDIGWAVVYAVSGSAFLGVVDHSKSHSGRTSNDGILISLTTNSIEQLHSQLLQHIQVSAIEEVPGAGLKSFFFQGPEGFQFEIQQFIPDELARLFS